MVIWFHSTVKAPWVSNPPRGLLCSLINQQLSSLKMFSSTVKAPWVSNPPRGFSLVEVLVVGVVGSIIMAGTLKTLSLSVQSSQVARSSISEQTINSLVGDILNNENECKVNLHPNKITGEDKLKGAGSVKALTQKSATILKTRSVFKNSLEIVDMRLSGEKDSSTDSLNDPKTAERDRTFSVYYKKKGLGSLSTLGGGDCTSTNTDGCYFYQCKLRYQLSSLGTTVTRCSPLDCLSSSTNNDAVAGVNCAEGQYLKGFDPRGRKICRTLPLRVTGACPSGRYLAGFYASGRKYCKPFNNRVLRTAGSCSSGYYLRGFNSYGRKICKKLPSGGGGRGRGSLCGSNQVLMGFTISGTPRCVSRQSPEYKK